jgi:hypothetical protein
MISRQRAGPSRCDVLLAVYRRHVRQSGLTDGTIVKNVGCNMEAATPVRGFGDEFQEPVDGLGHRQAYAVQAQAPLRHLGGGLEGGA